MEIPEHLKGKVEFKLQLVHKYGDEEFNKELEGKSRIFYFMTKPNENNELIDKVIFEQIKVGMDMYGYKLIEE